jgi:histidine triad (HIT) family protein
MSSIFTKIIQGEIPSIKVDENEYSYALMDIYPLRAGHVLVVSKNEVDSLFDLDEQNLNELMNMSKRIANAMKKAIVCERIGLSVIGLEIPHAHIHLVPINEANDINFAQPKMKMNPEEIQQIANRIIEELS